MKTIYIECVVPGVEGAFHYHVPESLASLRFQSGVRLLVPFARYWKVAFFIRIIQIPEVSKTKAILARLDEHSLFRPKLLKLLFWISDYYQTPLAQLMKTALPAGMHALPRRRFRALDNVDARKKTRASLQIAVYDFLVERGACGEDLLRRAFGRKGLNVALSALKKKTLIAENWELSLPKVREKKVKIIRLIDDLAEVELAAAAFESRAPRQFEVLKRLLAAPSSGLPLSVFEASHRDAVRRLLARELIVSEEKQQRRSPDQMTGIASKGEIKLNTDQSDVFEKIEEAIKKAVFSPFLLHGVTGSGKTEVYLNAIATTLARGQSAILLLPEIGLTTHISARFQERFGNTVALLHSGLSPGERYDEWRRIQSGEARLVIGARSAVFAPVSSLGIVIVDEEHDASYRQDEGSRYHGRDVALVRARDYGAVVILGSATPSFESYHNASSGKYQLLSLPSRIDARPLPKVYVVNLKDQSEWVRPFITSSLHAAIKRRLALKEQSLLFVNRRGFAPFLLCNDCGFTPLCKSCSVSLTFHKQNRVLVCHYCDYRIPPPGKCPDCLGYHLNSVGIGTEQIEDSIQTLFPKARIARLDRDTAQKKGATAHILSEMANNRIDILIGTQMIAKGHDFPGVTLVGVISADMSLHVPDFRASERTFQLLAQVSGRAGRGEKPGAVIVQSFQLDDPTILAASSQDYVQFYQDSIAMRKVRSFPPFSRLTLLLFSHKDESQSEAAAALMAELLETKLQHFGVTLMGPAPAPLLRIREHYRHQILLKAASQDLIATHLRSVIPQWSNRAPKSARLDIEVDPQQFV